MSLGNTTSDGGLLEKLEPQRIESFNVTIDFTYFGEPVAPEAVRKAFDDLTINHLIPGKSIRPQARIDRGFLKSRCDGIEWYVHEVTPRARRYVLSYEKAYDSVVAVLAFLVQEKHRAPDGGYYSAVYDIIDKIDDEVDVKLGFGHIILLAKGATGGGSVRS